MLLLQRTGVLFQNPRQAPDKCLLLQLCRIQCLWHLRASALTSTSFIYCNYFFFFLLPQPPFPGLVANIPGKQDFFLFWYWAFNQRLSRARQTSCHGVACLVPSYSPQNVHSRTVQLSIIVPPASSSSPHQQACGSLSHPSAFLHPRAAAPDLPLLP